MCELHVFRVNALVVSTDLCFCTGGCLYPPHPQLSIAAKNCLAQAVVLARLCGLMHLDLLAYVVAYVCFLPIPSRIFFDF